jgi:two-component system, NtrC family, sensor histidine kinase HydH
VETILSKALGQDLSKMALAEKQLLLARLLARLAHEIRNPLSSLDIHAQLLEEDLAHLPPDTRDKLSERFAIIRGEIHRLENLVKQFLRLAGPSELEIEEVPLERIVRHVCELLRPEASARGIDLQLDLPDPVPTLLADSGQLTQALLNLVINGLQAVGERGRIIVRIQLSSPNTLSIEVQDNGPGVPIEAQSTIFEPYFTTKEEGSGLGLWIAQQIATAHGGEIRVWNSPEGGAVFALRLPMPAGAPHHG